MVLKIVSNLIEQWKRKKYAEKLDAGLDSFLSLFGLELELKQKLENAFRHTAAHTPFPLRAEMLRALERYEAQGMSLEESLQKMNEYGNSPALARVITLLVHMSKQGLTAHGPISPTP